MIQHFGQSDAATYVKGAYALREGGIRAYCDQGFRTWSPGLSFIEMILMGMWHDIPLPFALLLLTFALSMLTFGTGRTNILFGLIHMVVFAIFVFMVFVP